MKSFVLKLRTNVDVGNGIAVVSKNDDTVVLREYHKKDEILRTYEEKIAFSWFVISVEDDEVIYVNNQKWNRYRFISEGVKDTIYLNSTPELFIEAKRNGVVLPGNYIDAFTTALRELFKFPVFPNEKRKWSSATIFNRYKTVLFQLDKTVNDFLSQEEIDGFFNQMVNLYALSKIKMMLEGKRVSVSPDVETKINGLKKELSYMGTQAFNAFIANGIKDWDEEQWSTMRYNNTEITVRVNNAHVYVVIPYGKSEVWECVGWLWD